MLKWKKCLTGVLAGILTFASIPVFANAETDKDAVILYTNDVHCAIDDYSKLAAYAAQLEADGQEVLIIDAGDAIQGDTIGSLTEGSAIIDLMNTVGYDYAVPGNHEFDYGMETFLNLTEDANSNFKYLSSNFVDLKTGNTVFDAYDIVELNDEKIALVGIATPESYTKSAPTYFQDENGNVIYGFSADTNAEFYASVQTAIDAARANGADRVIAIGHLGIKGTTEGWKSTDVIANTTGIDVFIDAHTHEVIESATYPNKNGDDVLLSSTGTKFQYFGELTLDDDNVETTALVNPDNVDVTASDAAESAYYAVQDKIDAYNDEISYLYEEIGTSEVDLTLNDADGNWAIRVLETNMANYITDAYKAMTGADIAIANAGGIRASVDAGDVTRKALMDVNPWNNEMCVVKATGQQILDALEFGARLHPENNVGFLHVSGLTYELHNYIDSPVIIDSSNSFVGIEEGQDRRIANVKVNGEAIDPEKEYTLAATKYILQNGGDGFTMFKDCEVVEIPGLACDSEMLIHYLKDTLGGVITEEQYGEAEGRIKVYSSEEEVYQYLKVAGVSVNKSNADDILGDGTVSYDVETNTLTLNNADISTSKEDQNYPVYAKGDLNIVLKGENKLSSEYYYGIAIVDPANADSVNVTISGDGTLDSYGSDGGIFVKGSLTVKGDVTVNGHCGDVTSGSAYGIRVNNDIEICENAKVTAKAGAAPVNSYALYAGDNFTACCNAEVTVEAGLGTERSGGLYAISNIYIKDDAVVTAVGADTSESTNYASESYGIRTTHMYVSGGTLNTKAQGATGISAGIFTQDFELSGGTVNTESVDAGAAQSIGMQSTKTCVISGGTLNAAGGDSDQDSWAIDASNGITISGGNVNCTTGTGERTYGISADTVTITDGNVTVEAGDALLQSRGIRSMNDFIISGGTVNVKAGNAEKRSYGLQSSTTLSIVGGDITVAVGEAEQAVPLYAGSEVNIEETCALIVKGSCGENAEYTLDISNGVLTISGSGDMTDYEQIYDAPWYDHKDIITKIIVEEGITSIGNAAFCACENLETVLLPDSLKEIGVGAFAGSGMTEIELPENLTTIGEAAFIDSSLTKITIPASVTSIGNTAFSECAKLLEIHFDGNAPELTGDYVFSDTTENLTVYIYEDATGFEGTVWNDMTIVVKKRPVVVEPDEEKPTESDKDSVEKPTESDKDSVDKPAESDKGSVDKTTNSDKVSVNTNTSSGQNNAAKTGDSANIMLWAVVAVLSMGTIVMVRRKQKA